MKDRIKTSLLLGAMLVMASTPLRAVVVMYEDGSTCQDYDGFPRVGGTRVCHTTNGYTCTFESIESGVSGGCVKD
jgi:hypothetical protein